MQQFDTDQSSAFQQLALGLGLGLLWLPWVGAADLVNAVGLGLAWIAVGKLRDLHDEMPKAQLLFGIAAVVALLSAIAECAAWGRPGWKLIHIFREGKLIWVPLFFHLEDFLAGCALWKLAVPLSERAQAAGAIALRDGVVRRRDAWLIYLVGIGLMTGLVLVLVYARLMRPGMYSALLALVGLWKLVVAGMWWQLIGAFPQAIEAGERGAL